VRQFNFFCSLSLSLSLLFFPRKFVNGRTAGMATHIKWTRRGGLAECTTIFVPVKVRAGIRGK